jgi:hypothetical protein
VTAQDECRSCEHCCFGTWCGYPEKSLDGKWEAAQATGDLVFVSAANPNGKCAKRSPIRRTWREWIREVAGW